MAKGAKPQVRAIFKVGGFLAFIMLGYLTIRSYKLSAEKLKVKQATDEVWELVYNIKERLRVSRTYEDLNYQNAVRMNMIPKKMFKEGYREAVNAYNGGVDMWYSSLNSADDYAAFEISYQGITKMGCQFLIKINWDEGSNDSFIAVGGYSSPTPSGVLDLIFQDLKQKDIKAGNIFKSPNNRYISQAKLESICNCSDNNCTVVWKFK